MQCSGLVRPAFLNAQKRLHKIYALAKSLTEQDGDINFIVESSYYIEDANLTQSSLLYSG